MIKERVIPHFAHPKGAFGWVAGRIMASRETNVQRNLWLAEILSPRPDARLLEIGHGPGLAVERLWPRLTTGCIVGVEISQLMSNTAARRNRAGVSAGRVEFRVGDSAALPDDLTDFDIIYGSNASMFWDDPAAAIADLSSRLKPGGELVLSYMPPPTADQAAETVAADIAEAYIRAGLVDVATETMDFEPPVIAVRARRPEFMMTQPWRTCP